MPISQLFPTLVSLSLSQISQAGAVSDVAGSITTLLNFKMLLFFIVPVGSVYFYRKNHLQI
jgi:fatty acid-binding protein DegV